MVLNKHIKISEELKDYLESKRKIDRETYDQVIRRLIRFKEDKK